MTPYLRKRALHPPQITSPPPDDLGIVVVIPAYREPQLLRSLQALLDCELPSGSVEVIVVLNDREGDAPATTAFHRQRLREIRAWAERHDHPRRRFFAFYHGALPHKRAGVGTARKIGMDEAVYRFEGCGQQGGIIACFDADSTCAPNYLRALEKGFWERPKMPACSIQFAHPLRGEAFSPAVYEAIAAYELHLRYYLQAQRWAGFPHAYHTVGSSMAVRADAYQQQGGMNRRKAGEDFYFLHKFTPFADFGELLDTWVYPSPRPSDRVPFGTGRSVGELLGSTQPHHSYALDTFRDLRVFLQRAVHWHRPPLAAHWSANLPPSIQDFLRRQDFEAKLREIRENTTDPAAFRKRFFAWFNAFQLMKYVHFARDHYHPDRTVAELAGDLIAASVPAEAAARAVPTTVYDLLLHYRDWQSRAWAAPR
ncbi:MAG: glycosyltransferase family 2 protein [Bacteroidota bacterium]